MSLEAMTWAIEMNGLTPTENHVLLLLANRHNKDSGLCYPSIPRICTESGLGRSTVIRAIKRLEGRGLLTIEKTFGKSNYYRLQTSITEIPVSERHPFQRATAPVSERHPTSVTVTPEPKVTQKNPKSQRKKFTDEHMAVAKEMADILQLRKAPNLDKWADTVRLMVERDKLSCDEVMRLFRAANAHHFWGSNILSPEKLRDKWDQLQRQLIPKNSDDNIPTELRYLYVKDH